MIRYIAFLRGINVSGQKLIKMADLKVYFEMPGIRNVVTYIQSGNVLFDAKEADEAMLHKKISAQLEKKLGYEVTLVLRELTDIQEVIKNNPFDKEKTEGKKGLYVTFLSEEPKIELRRVLDAFTNENEYMHLVGREVYVYSESYGETKFSNTFIEKKLGVSATTRNWATVNKILVL